MLIIKNGISQIQTKKTFVDDITNNISATNSDTIFKYVKETKSLFIRYNNSWNDIKISATTVVDSVVESNNIVKLGNKLLNTNQAYDEVDNIKNKKPMNEYVGLDIDIAATSGFYDDKIIFGNTSGSTVYFSSFISEDEKKLNYYNDIGINVSAFDITNNYNLKIVAGNGIFVICVDGVVVGNVQYSNSYKINTVEIKPKPNSNINTDYIRINSVYDGLTLPDTLTFISGNEVSNKKRNW